jgi:hypothetical protein
MPTICPFNPPQYFGIKNQDLRMKTYLTSCFCWLLLPLLAQNFYESGIIVTQAGDTLKGFIRDDRAPDLTFAVYFKQHQNDKPHRYLPDAVKAFFLAPDQYFEAHTVSISGREGQTRRMERVFLHRIESGNLSVFMFEFAGKPAYFLKKHGDSTLHPLFMSVQQSNDAYAIPMDTLTDDNDHQTLLIGEYLLGSEYLKTFIKLTKDGKKYQRERPDFRLTESAVTYAVRQYNRRVHPKFKTTTLHLNEKGKPIWTLGINAFTPLAEDRQLKKNIERVLSFQRLTSQAWGYEIMGGITGYGKMKGVGLEVGFGSLSAVEYKYLRSVESAIIGNITHDGTIRFQRNNYLARLNYAFSSSARFSFYSSVGVAITHTNSTAYILGQNNPNPLTFVVVDDYALNRSTEAFFALGSQYAFSRNHVLRAEMDWSPAPLERPFRYFLRVGYQYRFWK